MNYLSQGFYPDQHRTLQQFNKEVFIRLNRVRQNSLYELVLFIHFTGSVDAVSPCSSALLRLISRTLKFAILVTHFAVSAHRITTVTLISILFCFIQCNFFFQTQNSFFSYLSWRPAYVALLMVHWSTHLSTVSWESTIKV